MFATNSKKGDANASPFFIPTKEYFITHNYENKQVQLIL